MGVVGGVCEDGEGLGLRVGGWGGGEEVEGCGVESWWW